MGTKLLAAAAVGIILAGSVPAAAKNGGGSGPHGPPQNGTPYGFSQGNAGWKSDPGVPPGWAVNKGEKTGWSCGGHHFRCRPPGLSD